MNRVTCCTLLLVTIGGLVPAIAQTPTNVAIYQNHAVACLIAVPDTASAFTLDSPGVMTFLETALVTRWTTAGAAVFRSDSSLARPLPSLKYNVEAASVIYAAARRRRLARTVSLALQFSWTSSSGQILRSERCTKSGGDFILRREVLTLESPAYPETTGNQPPAGWTRRYLEPIALGAATVLTVFLFFNLRSSRAPSGA